MDGIERIAAERQRQKELHDWTPEHDDEHDRAELAQAAICYTIAATVREPRRVLGPGFDRMRWPWNVEWWKPSDDPIRNLEKAGALVAAEIDRLIRKRESDMERRLDDLGVV